MKILVADDNQFYRLLLESTLSGWGYEVVSVKNGAEAVATLREKGAPPIAILDWMMPEVDGLEVCRQVRQLQRPEPTYLILLTVKEGKQSRIAALEVGADDFLTKPFDQTELRARLLGAVRTVGLQSSLALRVRQLEDALSGAAKLEAIGRLAGGVSHDFNNILTIILGYSELLLQQRTDDAVREHAGQIKGAAERASRLTRQLLIFSRQQMGTPVPLNLNDLAGQFDKMLRQLLSEDIELRLDLAPGLENILGDPGQMEQVIMNLVVNARDAMPEGGRITLETENIPPEDLAREGLPPDERGQGYVRLSVTDTGHGMDEVTQARIFEPFFTTKPLGQGTGLGLATVYGIVKQGNGVIRLWSQPGRGTVFNLFFPATRDEAPRALVADVPGQLPRGGETILLAEDEEGVRRLAAEALRSNGYRVLVASDGQAALQLAERFPGTIHLLLTDVVMPHLNGWELAERVARLRPDSKILFMSGYSEHADTFHLSPHLAYHFLAKPFSLSALVEKVRPILDGTEPGLHCVRCSFPSRPSHRAHPRDASVPQG